MAGVGGGRSLELRSCTLTGVQRVWADEDRPRLVAIDDCVLHDCDADGGPATLSESLCGSGGRHGDDGDSTSTDSLETAEFAGIERLIERIELQALDRAAISQNVDE